MTSTLRDLATRTTDLPTRPIRVTGRVLGTYQVGRRVTVVFDESAAWEYAKEEK